jgi:NADH:ubiquinone oxidoreductase subunit K
MNAAGWADHYGLIAGAATVLFVAGLGCILLGRNLVRILIGAELLTKAVTLLIMLAGCVTGRTGVAQAFVIMLIALEVVAVAVAAGIIVGVYRHHGRTRARVLQDLKH